MIDWREHQQILKLEVPTALADASAYAMVPGGVAEPPANGNERPDEDWVAVEGTKEGKLYTVALLNNSMYSYDCLDGLLRTILIWSPAYAGRNPIMPDSLDAWQDQSTLSPDF